MNTRSKEHQWHICLEHPEKISVADQNIGLGYHIQLHHTIILSTKHRYLNHVVMEVIEIELERNNMNREDGFCLSK
jgi:hypothetical protein